MSQKHIFTMYFHKKYVRNGHQIISYPTFCFSTDLNILSESECLKLIK